MHNTDLALIEIDKIINDEIYLFVNSRRQL